MKEFLSKCAVLKVDLLQYYQIYCLQTCMYAHFSPETLQAGAVKGLIFLAGNPERFSHVLLTSLAKGGMQGQVVPKKTFQASNETPVY